MIWAWLIFIGFVLLMLALDLGVFHRKSHVVGFKESLGWSAVWITLGLAFSSVVYFAYDRHWFGLGMAVDAVDGVINSGKLAATKYLTGYVVEKSLSVDNIFVIAMIFGSLAVPAKYQHRVLFWGILGALLLRGLMIGVGSALVANFHWVLYIFGAFLIFTAIKMLVMKDKEEHPENNPLVRWLRKFFPVTRDYHGQHFIVTAGEKTSEEPAVSGGPIVEDPVVAAAPKGKRLLTPLAVALVLVEFTDVIFAVDSIPAIFAITADPFLVFTSNVFAILGLRSLYFALAGMIAKFVFLKPALSMVLLVVGGKMLAAKWLKELLGESFNFTILGVILAILATGVVASLVAGKKQEA
ncbi:TerC family protein [Luteolibacter ambystomatis]|uniref:TerC family protein n=1 Tax=Luteolibacter ambystomatis TaxID=2824561 RepID=A0A975G845_9BACT|nr:TerC family protein [Luteolibacter ambystomatis]QUE50050.1 TerC family protein [Luteolibacter ambystomatis]